MAQATSAFVYNHHTKNTRQAKHFAKIRCNKQSGSGKANHNYYKQRVCPAFQQAVNNYSNEGLP